MLKDKTDCLEELFDLCDIAKVVKPGARRMGLSTCNKSVEAAAVKNPDGSVGVMSPAA